MVNIIKLYRIIIIIIKIDYYIFSTNKIIINVKCIIFVTFVNVDVILMKLNIVMKFLIPVQNDVMKYKFIKL
jgi:hypothetical protein